MSSRTSIAALVAAILALVGFLGGWSQTAGGEAEAGATQTVAATGTEEQAAATGPLGPGEVLLAVRFLSVTGDETAATFTGLVERVEPADADVKADAFVTVVATADTRCIAAGAAFPCNDRKTVLGQGGGATVRGAVRREGTKVTVAATSIDITGR